MKSIVVVPTPETAGKLGENYKRFAIESARRNARRILHINPRARLSPKHRAQVNHMAIRGLIVVSGVAEASLLELALQVYADSEWELLDLPDFKAYVDYVILEESEGPIGDNMRRCRHLLLRSIPILHSLKHNPVDVIVPSDNGSEPHEISIDHEFFIDRPGLFQEISPMIGDVVPSTPEGRARIEKAVELAATAKRREDIRQARYLSGDREPRKEHGKASVRMMSFPIPLMETGGKKPLYQKVGEWDRQIINWKPGFRVIIDVMSDELLDFVRDMLSSRIDFEEES